MWSHGHRILTNKVPRSLPRKSVLIIVSDSQYLRPVPLSPSGLAGCLWRARVPQVQFHQVITCLDFRTSRPNKCTQRDAWTRSRRPSQYSYGGLTMGHGLSSGQGWAIWGTNRCARLKSNHRYIEKLMRASRKPFYGLSVRPERSSQTLAPRTL